MAVRELILPYNNNVTYSLKYMVAPEQHMVSFKSTL